MRVSSWTKAYKELLRNTEKVGVYKNYGNRKLMHRICRLLENHRRPGDRFLDVGCGDGQYMYLAKSMGYTVIGMDISRDRLKHARCYSKVTVGDIAAIPFKAECFDVVLCTEVLEHVIHQKKSIPEISGILKYSGRLILSVPTHGLLRWLPAMFNKKCYLSPDHVREYSIFPFKHHYQFQRLSSLLKACNLEITETYGAFFSDFPRSQRIANIKSLSRLFDLFEIFGNIKPFKYFCRYVIFTCIKKSC